jgi:WD40 repeat protein
VRRLSRNEEEFVGGIPELWNADVTERLFSFPELTGTFRCLSVAEDLVGCIMASQVCFFDAVKKEIVARTQLPEYNPSSLARYTRTVGVIACGSQYHVLFRGETTLLLQDTNVVDLSLRVLNNLVPVVESITTADFSPSGGLLVFSSDDKRLYILDILTLKIRCDVPLEIEVCRPKLKFVDEEHLLCAEYNNLLLINVKTCDILTSINIGMDDYRWRSSICCKTSTILLFDLGCKKLKVIKLWLPHQRKDASELLESCCSSNA